MDNMLPVQNIQLTATEPSEMINAQQKLITWCDLKISYLGKEATDLLEATDHAKKMKWKSSALEGQYNRCVRRVEYYKKIKAALLEGYYVVPNFPIQMFAIRTKAKNVKGSSHSYWGNHNQDAQELTIGGGEYKNPAPIVQRLSEERNSDNKIIQASESFATEWDDFEFPITMAKPRIMEATSRAMALKIFDQIGIMPPTRNDDPVIIGQIFNKNGYSKKTVSFMIAWHLDTKVL